MSDLRRSPDDTRDAREWALVAGVLSIMTALIVPLVAQCGLLQHLHA